MNISRLAAISGVHWLIIGMHSIAALNEIVWNHSIRSIIDGVRYIFITELYCSVEQYIMDLYAKSVQLMRRSFQGNRYAIASDVIMLNWSFPKASDSNDMFRMYWSVVVRRLILSCEKKKCFSLLRLSWCETATNYYINHTTFRVQFSVCVETLFFIPNRLMHKHFYAQNHSAVTIGSSV